MTSHTNIQEMHTTLAAWKQVLLFYDDDLIVLRKRLDQVAHKNTHQDVRVWIERFQNKLLIQKEQLDILMHEIGSEQQQIEEDITGNVTATDHRKTGSRLELKEKLDTFELLFNALRKELIAFCARWM